MKATKFLISTAAAVTVAGAIGLAYAQTNTYNAPGTTGSAQTQTTTTGQTPANVPGTQSQQQNAAPASPQTQNTTIGQAPTGSTMNDGTTARTSDGNTNARRNTPNTNGGMATERDARPDRN